MCVTCDLCDCLTFTFFSSLSPQNFLTPQKHSDIPEPNRLCIAAQHVRLLEEECIIVEAVTCVLSVVVYINNSDSESLIQQELRPDSAVNERGNNYFRQIRR